MNSRANQAIGIWLLIALLLAILGFFDLPDPGLTRRLQELARRGQPHQAAITELTGGRGAKVGYSFDLNGRTVTGSVDEYVFDGQTLRVGDWIPVTYLPNNPEESTVNQTKQIEFRANRRRIFLIAGATTFAFDLGLIAYRRKTRSSELSSRTLGQNK